MIVLHGIDAMGSECCVLQHMFNVELAIRVIKVGKETKTRRIGFLHKKPKSKKK